MRTFPTVAALVLMMVLTQSATAATAVFAGGCFWCMESAYQDVTGVTDVISGFTGGTHPSPTYSGAHSGHYEAVLVSFNPEQISYQQLLDLYWRNIDPSAFVLGVVVLCAVALAASYLPARRATLVDPVQALRAE